MPSLAVFICRYALAPDGWPNSVPHWHKGGIHLPGRLLNTHRVFSTVPKYPKPSYRPGSATRNGSSSRQLRFAWADLRELCAPETATAPPSDSACLAQLPRKPVCSVGEIRASARVPKTSITNFPGGCTTPQAVRADHALSLVQELTAASSTIHVCGSQAAPFFV